MTKVYQLYTTIEHTYVRFYVFYKYKNRFQIYNLIYTLVYIFKIATLQPNLQPHLQPNLHFSLQLQFT